MIATRVKLIGAQTFELITDTLEVETAYIREWSDRGDNLITVHRPNGGVFEAVAFPAGTFRYEHKEYLPDVDGWRYTGVDSSAGWYVIDPEMTQPYEDSKPTAIMPVSQLVGVEPDDGRGLFIPRLSSVAESFKRLFGKW